MMQLVLFGIFQNREDLARQRDFAFPRKDVSYPWLNIAARGSPRRMGKYRF
ncbi:hypothetical protein D3C75_1105110 [compost metagenome]